MKNIVALTLLVAATCAAAADLPGLMPMPAKLEMGAGSLTLPKSIRVAVTKHDEPRLRSAITRTVALLGREEAIAFAATFVSTAEGATLVVECEGPSAVVQKLGEDESYRLSISAGGARLSAANPLGILRGLETLLQLADKGKLPAVVIDDRPRFAWRGLLLDVSRHWMPLDVVKRNLDGMAAVKLNTLHWHLTDDQGFRVESKRFPLLTTKGSDKLYYTQAQIKEVIAYARDRGIRVLPEFDIPAHSSSWVTGMPELASGPGPFSIGRHWGVFEPALDPTRESVYEFLDAFIGEMAALFPAEYFHIGGDEVNGKQWDRNPAIQAFMKEHDFKTNDQLQAYFNKRVQVIVTKHGKRMVGWDEILDPSLSKDIVIQSWRGPKSLAEAARLGYPAIRSSDYYLDLIYPASKHYLVDPLGEDAASLSKADQQRVLGGEACMWAEFVGPETVDSRIWPRMAAIAERFWSPAEVKDVDSMYTRLQKVDLSLAFRGLKHRANYDPMLRRLTHGAPIGPLKTLADIVEPVKGYGRSRPKGKPRPTQQMPLTRLVDAARPESMPAREFAQLVDAKDTVQVRKELVKWRDNHLKLNPILLRSPQLKEVGPVSDELTKVATIGLAALDYAKGGKTAPSDWAQRQRTILDDAAKPRAEVLIMIVPAVQKLLEQAAH